MKRLEKTLHAFHAGDRGSNPLGDANHIKGLRKQPLLILCWV